MAKERHSQEAPTSSTRTLAILVGGIVIVAGLIVWAMTRNVDPVESASVDTVATTASYPTATNAPLNPGLTLPGATPTATNATNATPTAPPPHPEGDRSAVTRIAAEDLRAKMGRNEVTLIDVRDAGSYAREHITGAVNMPFASLEAQIDAIPKGKPIVLYCT
jgi:hypothetical protein